MTVLHMITYMFLVTLMFPKKLASEFEISEDGIVYCSNIRSTNKDYMDSIENELPEYLDYAALTRGPNISLVFLDCDLNGLPDDLLDGFNVTLLALSENDFDVFPIGFMYFISSDVEVFSLEDNNIEDFLWKGHVDRLPFAKTLKTLIMRKCQLVNLGEGAFKSFTSLQELDLSENLIFEVPARGFENHYTLENIDLSNNFLHSLSKSAFIDLPSLKKLDLSFNYISIIEAGTFVKLESLNYLNLFDNELLAMEETTFNKRDVPKLLDLQIGENPFICNCELQWLKLWFIEHSSLEYSDATCFLPEVAEFGEVDFCPSFILELNITQF